MERWQASLDRYLTTPPEHATYCECEYCGNEIYEGEEYAKVDNGDCVHEDCLHDYALEQISYRWETADSKQDYEDYLADKADRERDDY